MATTPSLEQTCTESFSPFLDRLAQAAQDESWHNNDYANVEMLLDGAAGQAVITHVPKHVRSRDGIFFSGHRIAELATRSLASSIAGGASVYDPACGAGDLLLAAAAHMPLKSSVEKTLASWGEKIGGCDIHTGFVDATKWRLLMLAMLRHKLETSKITPRSTIQGLFPNIVVANFFDTSVSGNYDCIITNPPYGRIDPLISYSWGSGHVQLAGVFIDHLIKLAKAGQKIVAILPDVLRSGSRYGKWRAMVAQCSKDLKINSYGRFDASTNVDVFLLAAEIYRPSSLNYNKSVGWTCSKGKKIKEAALLGHIFDVRVGPVVPHRHEKKGPMHPYIHVRNATPFSEVYASEARKFEGTVILPPFVVIRRTSNPADTNRLVSTIVRGNLPIAVENHLIILKPKDKKLRTCRALHKHLASDEACDWINSQIRCRHITTKVLLAMPLYKCEFISDTEDD